MMKKKLAAILREHRAPIILFMILASFIIIFEPRYQGHYVEWRYGDIVFHVSRMLSLDTALTSPTDFRYFQHMGTPINLMYPWLFLLPWRLLYTLTGHNPYLSYYIFSALIVFTSLAVMYGVVWSLKRHKGLAMTIAVAYTFAFYHVWGISYRFSVGENLSFMVMPLLLLAIHRIFFESKPRWRLLVVTMTLIAYMHYLSLLIYSFVIFIVLIIQLLRHQCRARQLYALVKATIWTVILSVASLVPMALYGKLNQLDLPHKGDVASRALNMQDFFHNTFDMSFGIDAATCGWLILVLAILCLIYFVKASMFEKSLIWVGWLSLIATTAMINWYDAQYTMLGVLQFPWRFFSISTLCFSYVGIIALFHYAKKVKKSYLSLAVMALFVGFFIYDATSYTPRALATPEIYWEINNQTIKDMVDGKEEWNGSGRLDYAPASSVPHKLMFFGHYMRMNYHYYLLDVETTGREWKTSFTSTAQTKAIMPVFANKDYKVTVNGKEQPLKRGYNGGIEIQTAVGKNTVSIKAYYPPYVYLAWIISLIGLVIFYRKSRPS